MAEKRKFKRKRRRMPVRFEADGQSATGHTHDLSLTGLSVLSATIPSLGSTAKLEIELPGGDVVTCDGIVLRRHSVPGAQPAADGFSLQLTGYFEAYCEAVEAL